MTNSLNDIYYCRAQRERKEGRDICGYAMSPHKDVVRLPSIHQAMSPTSSSSQLVKQLPNGR